jgi:hypothetical protein
VPENLEGLLEMKGYKHAFNLKFLKLILDVTRTAGHYNSRYIKMMTKSVTQTYLTIYKVSLDIIKGYNTLHKRYNKVLT